VSALDEEATDETFGRHFTHERPGCQIHYWLAGAPDAPLVALSHAALTDHRFSAALTPALVPHYRVLTWDIRGHGPTLLIVGQHDKTGNIRKSMAAWAQREPADEHHMIEGAGHCANLDRPEQVTTLITGFLARHLHPRRKDVSRRCQAVWRLVFMQFARLAKEYREAR